MLKKILTVVIILLSVPAHAEGQKASSPANDGSITIGAASKRNFGNSVERAVINRLNDKLFIAGATVSDGSYPNRTKDWLSTYQSHLTDAYSGARLNGTGIASALFVLNNDSNSMGAAVVAGSHTLNLPANGTSLASSAFCLNDKAGTAASCWGFYGEAHLDNRTGASQAVAMELDTRSTVPTVQQTPYSLGNAQGIQVACGAGVTDTGHGCSSALMIGANPTPFKAGIVSYRGQPGRAVAISDGAFAPFIMLDTSDEIVWYAAAGVPTTRIASSVDREHASASVRLINDNNGFVIQNNDAINVVHVSPAKQKVNVNQFDGAAALNVNGGLQLTAQKFAQLPACDGRSAGMMAFITDARDAITQWHQAVIRGGGSVQTFVQCAGQGWRAF